jgi:acylaminoacyl-peptidase
VGDSHAVVSSPTKPHSLKLGHLIPPSTPVKTGKEWSWFNISVPSLKYAEKVETSMSSMQYEVLQIPVPVTETHKNLSEGAKQPFEAIFVSPKASNNKPSAGETKSPDDIPPLVLVLHGGPHAVTQTSFSRTAAFLSALGFNLLHVNYRGSLGFGEEALQSLPGNVGHQDVGDVLTALDHVIENGLANPAKVAVIGGSHGGFLTSHLIGQVKAVIPSTYDHLSLSV